MEVFLSRCKSPVERIVTGYLAQLLAEGEPARDTVRQAMTYDDAVAAHEEEIQGFTYDDEALERIFGERNEYVRFWMLALIRSSAGRALHRVEQTAKSDMTHLPTFGMF